MRKYNKYKKKKNRAQMISDDFIKTQHRNNEIFIGF
jgi:hypothetical protein